MKLLLRDIAYAFGISKDKFPDGTVKSIRDMMRIFPTYFKEYFNDDEVDLVDLVEFLNSAFSEHFDWDREDDYVRYDKETPLNALIKHGKTGTVLLFLWLERLHYQNSLKLNPSASNLEASAPTPLVVALRHGKWRLFKKLLRAGALPHLYNRRSDDSDQVTVIGLLERWEIPSSCPDLRINLIRHTLRSLYVERDSSIEKSLLKNAMEREDQVLIFALGEGPENLISP